MYYQSLSRAVARNASSTLRPSTLACLNGRIPQSKQSVNVSQQQSRAATGHAISNPTLAGIEKRWEAMPPQEQAELWMQLRDRMKANWHEMTLQEKKAAYWIAFGPHGPRAEAPKGEGLKILVQVTKYVLISFGIYYAIRLAGSPVPKTMSKEWQEASNEYAKKEKLDPLTGITSEGYSGKGFVQSPPAEK